MVQDGNVNLTRFTVFFMGTWIRTNHESISNEYLFNVNHSKITWDDSTLLVLHKWLFCANSWPLQWFDWVSVQGR
jgi:hypothetical protein